MQLCDPNFLTFVSDEVDLLLHNRARRRGRVLACGGYLSGDHCGRGSGGNSLLLNL